MTTESDPTRMGAGSPADPEPRGPRHARGRGPDAIRLGLAANAGQFALLVLVNAFVGGMVGLERAIVPLLAEREFGQTSRTVILSFILSFGIVKALANLVAGGASDRVGRKPVLIVGWLAGLPVPFLIMFAPRWEWVVFANVLLGINQGLCWSAAVIMKMDLAGPARRGLAMGINEASGYLAVSLAALASGYLAATFALRPQPFVLGVALAVAGLLVSALWVRETHAHARHESALSLQPGTTTGPARPGFAQILLIGSWKDRRLFSASQAGMVNNLNDGVAWGLLPLFFAAAGLDLKRIALLSAIYPAVWGILQLGTGPLSDRVGRKRPIVAGMLIQAAALLLLVMTRGARPWAIAMALLGAGTALVYPTLLGAVSDVAEPAWRASAVGVYRLWRDGGYAVGALAGGLLADQFGIPAALAVVGALTFASGAVVQVMMKETLHAQAQPHLPGGGVDPGVASRP